ncbi:MucB/RseB C-terminal domain-containing protein [Methylomonas sp. UP202]|uniref:MucB/RseB C-terminal domain-containing protein n=1 Tax=unclassified Methylomonas TaxID=2608980 RepID=UPI00143AEDDE|nr:MucB/RseB C-terminal domain-containing protein [Methylomonas sp. UP202]NJA06809.1 transcriptional regulator [Methylococcaceae bacterium WWC4]WGS87951.1 MucB/RseB C-terminal domain-containing protein [Methylomonas sp. UP202]
MKVIAVFLFWVVCQTVRADDVAGGALKWLENMSLAMKTLSFQGTIIFMKNGQLDTMKYHHLVENGVEQERLTSLNSPMREVVRKSNEVTCIFKETQQKIVNHHPLDSSFIINMPRNTAGLEKNYQLGLEGQEAVAMLPTQIVTIQPKDDLRYIRKIWIDTQFYLPLKVEVYNLDGTTLEQVVFTDLSRDGVGTAAPAAATGDDSRFHTKHIHTSQAEPLEQAPFELKQWPPGFEPVFFIRNSIEKSGKAVDHLLISDGFATVSVYREAKEAQGIEGLHTLGSVNSVSRILGEQQITVLGEVPAKTVEMIAAGIVLR